ncbi:MAG: flagellar hook-associated protein FlgL [Candidatus Hydrogenedentota bacterium]
MGAMRVTTRSLIDRSLRHINLQSSRLLGLQEQLASGLRVNRPADDPIAARRAVNTRSWLEKNEQYLANINFVTPVVEETNASIETALSYFNRAWELTVQGSNGTYSQTQLDNIALEIDQILEGIFNTANHETNDRYIFSGTRTSAPPYEATRDANGEITAVTYVGNTEPIRVAVSDLLNLQYNEPGATVFSENQDIFQTLIDVRDNLRAGDQTAIQSLRLPEMETVQGQLVSSLARVGSVQNRLERTTEEYENFNLQLEIHLSDLVDADFAEVVTELNAQTNAFQAALYAASQAVRPSLMNYVE